MLLISDANDEFQSKLGIILMNGGKCTPFNYVFNYFSMLLTREFVN